ncbi:hypothetical protein D9M71_445870 [compost metagenome]
MPGNQVGGVFDDQPIQAPGAAGFACAMALFAGITAAAQHLLALVVRHERPQHDAFADLHFHIADRPMLTQTGTHQGRAIGRQPASQLRPFGDPGLQCRVECQRACITGQQQTGLWVFGKRGVSSVIHSRRPIFIEVLLYCYSRYS